MFVLRVSHSDNVVASLLPKCLEFIFEQGPRLRLSATKELTIMQYNSVAVYFPLTMYT